MPLSFRPGGGITAPVAGPLPTILEITTQLTSKAAGPIVPPAVFDPHPNFAYSTVLVPPSPATTGQSLVIQNGDGLVFAAPQGRGYPVTIWPAASATDPRPTRLNAELAQLVGGPPGDVFTLVRAQQGSTARAIIVGDQIAATVSQKAETDIEGLLPAAPGWFLIDSQQVGPTARSQILFQNIPQIYSDLELRVYAQSTAATTIAECALQFNGDIGANYDWQRWAASNSAGSASGQSLAVGISVGWMAGTSDLASGFSGIVATISNYTQATKDHAVVGDSEALIAASYAAGNTQRLTHGGMWHPVSPANIVSIRLFPAATNTVTASGNFAVGSRFDLYGLYAGTPRIV